MLKQWAQLFREGRPRDKKQIRERICLSILWLKKQSINGGAGGLRITDKQDGPYPEVTGYTIPTLINAGEVALAKKYCNFLIMNQKSDGSYPGNDGHSYFFDTGQVLRGLLAMENRLSSAKLRQAIIFTVDYLIRAIGADGNIEKCLTAPFIDRRINLYALSQLDCLPNWIDKQRRNQAQYKMLAAIKSYQKKMDLDGVEKLLTHFQAYIIDGYIECGKSSYVESMAIKILGGQWTNGFFPEKPYFPWMCTVSAAQFALIAYKLGRKKQAEKLVENLCLWQDESGSFYGSVGLLPRYFPNEKIPWASKFFIDSLLMYDKELE